MTLKNRSYAPKTQKNRYVQRAHFSSKKFKKLTLCFVQDLPASKIALLTGLSRPTVNKILMKIRLRLAQFCDEKKPISRQIEVDESYFGPRRVKKAGELPEKPLFLVSCKEAKKYSLK